jgi:hypothetical protein
VSNLAALGRKGWGSLNLWQQPGASSTTGAVSFIGEFGGGYDIEAGLFGAALIGFGWVRRRRRGSWRFRHNTEKFKLTHHQGRRRRFSAT